MADITNNNTQSIADYLAQLLKDKKQLAAFPNYFVHMERLLDEGKKNCPNIGHKYVSNHIKQRIVTWIKRGDFVSSLAFMLSYRFSQLPCQSKQIKLHQ